MRTYEVTMQVVRYEKVTVETDGVRTPTELKALVMPEVIAQENESANLWDVNDITPKPITDKQRFNNAFRELRNMGYGARQGLSPLDDGTDVYTMREDAQWAFRGQELIGMITVHWDYEDHENTVFHNQRVKILTSVFEKHGFSVEWEGRFFNSLQIRKGNA